MSIRKLMVAATLAAVGAAAHAGPMSSSAASGKDIGNLADGLFGSKMYSSVVVDAAPAAAPAIGAAPPAAALIEAASPAPAAPLIEAASPAPAAPLIEAVSPSDAAIVASPAAPSNIIGGSDALIVAMPAQIAPGLITPAVHEPTHVPEPASMALMLAGMVGVGAMRRRKQQR